MLIRRLRLTAILILITASGAAGQRGAPTPSSTLQLTPSSASLLLALDRLQAARWYPQTPQLRDVLDRDRQLVAEALASTNLSLRRLAIRGIGRFENPADVPRLAFFLVDPDPGVRRNAAFAIAQAVVNVKDDDVLGAHEALKMSVFDPRSRQAAGAFEAEAARRMAIVRLHHSQKVAQQLFETSSIPSEMLMLLRNNRKLEPTTGQIDVLIKMVRPPNARQSSSRDALEVLVLTGRAPGALLTWAVQYRCPEEIYPFACSAPVRQLAMEQLDAADPMQAQFVAAGLRDPLPQLRVAALRRSAAAIPETKSCGPLIDALATSELAMVKLVAISLLDARCEDRALAARTAGEYVSATGSATSSESGWPIRARVIEVLAKLDPDAAREALGQAGRDSWQVHVARVRAAASLRDVELIRRYVDDDHPNVRAEVVRMLEGLGHESATAEAIKNLDSKDYHLVMASTSVLRQSTNVPRDTVLWTLWQTFRRLTEEQRETSRYPRLEILYTMRDWASGARGSISIDVRRYVDDLRTTLQDFDPMIAEAAADIIRAATGTRPVPMPRYRPPQQPDEIDLLKLPGRAVVNLDSGEEIEITLLRTEAPLSVARFAKLVNDRYFNGQSLFYHIEPMLAVNGGSPNGNELSGDARFWREEIGPEPHRAGVVGLLNHGPDTADGRIFIELTDQPGFDFEYTLFARIVGLRLNEPWPFRPQLPTPPMMLVNGGKITGVRLY